MNSQNPLIRRAYLIRPRPELCAQLDALGLSDDFDFLARQTVVMTAPLPYGEKIEGYRNLILQESKKSFLRDLFEYEPLLNEAHRSALLGTIFPLENSFDRWWIAEEVETLEIDTTW